MFNKQSFLMLLLVKIFLFPALFSVHSCGSPGNKIDIEGIDIDVSIMRLEKDLFDMSLESLPEELTGVERKYGDFFEIFNHRIIRIGSSRSSSYYQHLRRFLTDFDIYRIHSEVERLFPDLGELEEALEEGFRHYIYYFPGYQVPQIYTYISGFNQSIVVADSILAIGLDKYLGSGHKFYAEMQLPLYQRSSMNPSNISPDCMISWAMTEFEFDNSNENLLSHMIYHGKFLYLANALLPGKHDTLTTGFSLPQLEWCINNEVQMWTYLVENRLLFSSDAGTIGRFINSGPFTSEFSRESPARAVVWLGWQIVKSYMSRHKDISMEELMLDTDYQGILNRARYRP